MINYVCFCIRSPFFSFLTVLFQAIDSHKGILQLSKTILCCSALSINWPVLTSNCPGDWDSVIENKNPSRAPQQKTTDGGVWRSSWTSQEHSWTKAQKQSLLLG